MSESDQFDSMDGFDDQGTAEDDVSGAAYEKMMDQGFTVPEREPHVDRFENVSETLEDRFYEEEPDSDPASGYGPPADAAVREPGFDDTRAGRLVAEDEGLGEDRDSELFAFDDGQAGGASSAEEAAMHYTDGDDAQGFDDGYAKQL